MSVEHATPNIWFPGPKYSLAGPELFNEGSSRSFERNVSAMWVCGNATIGRVSHWISNPMGTWLTKNEWFNPYFVTGMVHRVPLSCLLSSAKSLQSSVHLFVVSQRKSDCTP